MHTLERYALSDEPQPVSRADEKPSVPWSIPVPST